MARDFRRFASASVLLAALVAPGCSVRKVGVNVLAGAMAGGSDIYATDDDPELVAAAIPFGLKTIEGLLAESPRHEGLLLSAASGFTQYAFAFVQSEADYVEGKDLARATELRARARKLYARALRYGLRGLEVRHPGFEAGLRDDALREKALAAATTADVPLLYWTGAAWGAAISLSKENAELTADQGLAEALERRALALDEGFGRGAVHDFFIAFEGGVRPPPADRSSAPASTSSAPSPSPRAGGPPRTSPSPRASAWAPRTAPSSRRCSGRPSPSTSTPSPSCGSPTLVSRRRASLAPRPRRRALPGVNP